MAPDHIIILYGRTTEVPISLTQFYSTINRIITLLSLLASFFRNPQDDTTFNFRISAQPVNCSTLCMHTEVRNTARHFLCNKSLWTRSHRPRQKMTWLDQAFSKPCKYDWLKNTVSQHKRPENFPDLENPLMNPEISVTLKSHATKDTAYQNGTTRRQAGKGAVPIAR